MCKCRSSLLPGQKESVVRPARGLMVLAFVLIALASGFSQGDFRLPTWLVSYPGTNPTVHSNDSLAQMSYIVDAEPAEVVAHYRKLFEAQCLAFQPNPDGIGTTIRAAAKECDLFIQIRRREEGTFTKVTCTAKVDPSLLQPAANPNIEMITGITPPPPPESAIAKAKGDAGKEKPPPPPIKINKVPHNMPAPPLVWPSWLTHLSGDALRPALKTDPTGFKSLTAVYMTNMPMTDIFDFYRNLLEDHDYRPKAFLAAGHTAKGVQQNALGSVTGVHYVDGAPGANTSIDVSIDRTVLNGPITVTVRVAAHDFSTRERRGNR